jgi:hypothetical protein
MLRTWNERALDAIEDVKADRTIERLRAGLCSSLLIDEAVRLIRRAAKDPETPVDSKIWTWEPPAWGSPVVVRRND